MHEQLKNKLYRYISENNPDLLLSLQEKNKTTLYLANKVNEIDGLLKNLKDANTPEYIIEETCMEEMTKDLRPSKYNYISNVLEEEFEFAYQQFQKAGILPYEIVNVIGQCEPIFETLGFTAENENDRQLRYAVAGIIDKYLSK
jgi:hypothetical protein